MRESQPLAINTLPVRTFNAVDYAAVLEPRTSLLLAAVCTRVSDICLTTMQILQLFLLAEQHVSDMGRTSRPLTALLLHGRRPFAWIVTVPAAIDQAVVAICISSRMRFSVNCVPVFGAFQFHAKIRSAQIVEVPKLSARRAVMTSGYRSRTRSRVSGRTKSSTSSGNTSMWLSYDSQSRNHQMTCTPNATRHRERAQDSQLCSIRSARVLRCTR